MKFKCIAVTGDIAIDNLTYKMKAKEICLNHWGENGDTKENWRLYDGDRTVSHGGGALLLAALIQSATKIWCDPVPDVRSPSWDYSNDDIIHSNCQLQYFTNPAQIDPAKSSALRIKQFCGFTGPNSGEPHLEHIADDPMEPDLIVLDDAGNSFRNRKDFWPKGLRFHDKGFRPLIILKMSRPLGQGNLFTECRKNAPESTVLIVSVQDLRDSGVKISRRLSWEQTIHNLVWHFANNDILAPLRSFSHVIIRFGLDGAVHFFRQTNQNEAIAYYFNKGLEDDYENLMPGQMQGFSNAFSAGLVGNLASTDDVISNLVPKSGSDPIGAGIKAGLLACRNLLRTGFVMSEGIPDYPYIGIFSSHPNETEISSFPIPDWMRKDTDKNRYWTILEESTRGRLESTAFNLVENGSDPLLSQVPIQSYGPLKVIDRGEIESYQNIKNLINEYLGRPALFTPLCIAAFGPPGSGKSFGIVKLAESVAGDQIKKIEFNMTQLRGEEDLARAFHQIRDISLSGKIPLVFFDEFDADYHGHLGWLKHFLAPMQDGIFSEGGFTHPIGRSILVFAGGTSDTFNDFKCREKSEGEISCVTEFKDVKGPDFLSRLKGYIDIKGLNPNPPQEDPLAIVRRALILRVLLEEHAPQLKKDKNRLCVDHGILNAFLNVPKYYHGVRSMLAIISMSALTKRKKFDQSALPSYNQLTLHVDANSFLELVESDVLSSVLFGRALEDIAMASHKQYVLTQKTRKDKTDPAMQPWDSLMTDLQESNRQQAANIPEKLRVISCKLARKRYGLAAFSFSDEEIEILAQMEHDRWMNERIRSGWIYGQERYPEKKISPYLVSWDVLSNDIKEFDREAIRVMPTILSNAGFGITRR